MIILGVILLLLGYFIPLHLLYVIGAILTVLGVVLLFVPVGGYGGRTGRRLY